MTSATIVDSAAVAPRTRSRAGRERVRSAIARFLAAPASPLPFGVLRIGLGLVLLVQALSVVPNLADAYGTRGLVQSVLVDRLVPPLTPRVGWFVALLERIGVDEIAAIRLFFALHVGAVLAFTVGWRSRLAAVLTWATFVTLTTSGPLYTYGVDRFVRIALFYCMFAPIGAALSCDVVAGRTSGAPAAAARLCLRVLQLHLLVVYAASGIEKASGAQWWNGEALWRSMMRPDLGTLDFGWVASVPWLARIGCWATLLLECGYALFVWPRRTSKWWVLATLAMHAGIALVLGLWLFSATMMLLSFSAWLVPCEPRTLHASRRSGFTVAYDGSCRLCRSVVGLAFELDRSGFLPIGRDHPRRVPALAGTGRLERMVTVDRDGRMRSGADAFLAMWAHALSWPAIGEFARLAPVRAGYALFAQHRHELGCRETCSRTVRDVN